MLLDEAQDVTFADPPAEARSGYRVQINIVLACNAADQRRRTNVFAINLRSWKTHYLLRLSLLRRGLGRLGGSRLRRGGARLGRSCTGRSSCSADGGYHSIYLNRRSFLHFHLAEDAGRGRGNFRVNLVRGDFK